MQHNFNRETTKRSAVSPSKTDKCKYLKNEEVLTSSQSQITQKPLQGLEKHLTNRQFQLNGMETKKTEGIKVEEISEQSDQSEKSINFYQSI